METTVATYEGYTILYDSRLKRFIGKDMLEGEVASGDTQAEVEKTLDKLRKSLYKFPIKALQVRARELVFGNVTSFNLTDKSFWFVAEDGDRHKCRFWSKKEFYEDTPANRNIATDIEELAGQIKELEAQIDVQKEGLERPITAAYFNLEER